MSEHTLGPWIADPQGVVTGGPHGATSICETARHFYADRSTYGAEWAEQPHIQVMREEQEANGRLIAAAPDLLRACQGLLQEWPIPPNHPLMGEGVDVRAAYDAAVKAVAAATCRTHPARELFT